MFKLDIQPINGIKKNLQNWVQKIFFAVSLHSTTRISLFRPGTQKVFLWLAARSLAVRYTTYRAEKRNKLLCNTV